VAGNCSAFPEHLLESELFGHLRGAFIGASMAKPGKFELATGSAILFDEIGEMPLALQPKLLRVLQEQMRTVPCIVSES
jgi:transcriptional regulator with GAF, ATPase, and Fis domain